MRRSRPQPGDRASGRKGPDVEYDRGRDRDRGAGKEPASPTAADSPLIAGISGGGSKGINPDGGTTAIPPPESQPHRRGWIFLVTSILVLLAVLRWRWDRGWDDLESRLHSTEKIKPPETRVSADVMQRLVTHRVDPEYPEAARSANLQGIVIANIVIGRDGSVLSVHPLSGPEVFTTPAADALRWWRFNPYRVDGKPIVVETTVAVEFKP